MAGQKLELTWVGKDKAPKLEPRLLLEIPEKSYHASEKHGEDDQFENMLIHGDNLLALKALEDKYTGQVKCVYIDPPYNTGSAFEHYDDNLEHSIWLGLIRDRIKILHTLLSNEGAIFIQIDDNEQAYLKVIMDEIFGRENFVNCITVKMSEASGIKMSHAERRLPKLKEYILVYKKENIKLHVVKIPKEKWDNEYKTMIVGISDEELAKVKEIVANVNRTEEDEKIVQNILDKASYRPLSQIYKDKGLKDAKEKNAFNYENAHRIFQTVSMSGGTTLAVAESRKKLKKNIFFAHVTAEKKMYVIKGDYDEEMKKPRVQVLFADEYLTYNPCDLWTDIKTTGLDNEGGVDFKNSKKPELLIERILKMVTQPGDLVLDSFLGSGTTAAVAHKMRRRWIGVELGNHCFSHCIPRLKSVIDGSDQSGISKSVNWQGGGGFRFYELAPSLIKKDEYGVNVIDSEKFDEARLAEAVCKIMGFTYKPSAEEYFIHGQSTENAYIYVTTNYMTAEHMRSISQALGSKRYLSICCKAFEDVPADCENLNVQKIPKAILDKCEWGKDDYSLNVKNLPMADSVKAKSNVNSQQELDL